MKIFQQLAQKYSSPRKVQNFLRSLNYNYEENGETVSSPVVTLKKKKAHCLEATLLAAAIMEQQGYPPWIVNMDSSDHLCHAIFIFKTKTGWGAIGRSKITGLHGRAPRFRSIRDLVLSYVDPFVDATGRLTGYVVLNLDDSQTDWRSSPKNLWKLEQFIVHSKHQKLKSSNARFRMLKKRFLKEGDLLTGKHWW